jgi:ATP-dependent RNA helicase DeaD
MTETSFSDLGLSETMLRSLSEMGFEAPTSIQQQCIPHILQGRDIVGQAQTGTGKTAAFGIPMLEKLDPNINEIQAVIQCPTRELAIQVTGELMKMGHFMRGLHVVPVYGGQPISRQITALRRGAQVLVGTPGRTLDHLKRGTLKLDNLSMLIFDEADEMLNMGFREDMEALLEYVDHKIQTVMFSATIPPFIRDVMKKFMNEPEFITVDRKAVSAPDIKQYVVHVRDSMRTEAISRLMDVHNFQLGIVFCNTKRGTEVLAQELQARGYGCEILNGDLNQTQRDKVMQAFRTGKIDLLIATDVAARGIDVESVDVIFNYEIPTDPEYYVHRIGRTGRAGRKGTSITFSAPSKARRLKFIENQIKQRLEELSMPSMADVTESRIAVQLNDVKAVLEEGGLRPFIEQLEAFAESGYSPIEIAAAFLKLRTKMPEIEVETPKFESRGRDNYDDDRRGPRKGSRGEGRFEDRAPRGDRPARNDRSDRSDRPARNDRSDRPARTERGPREGRFDSDSPKTTLRFSIGKNANIRVGDIVGAVTGECGLPIDNIGQIRLLKFETFVDVNTDVANRVMKVMNNAKIKGNKVQVSPDKGAPHTRE